MSSMSMSVCISQASPPRFRRAASLCWATPAAAAAPCPHRPPTQVRISEGRLG